MNIRHQTAFWRVKGTGAYLTLLVTLDYQLHSYELPQYELHSYELPHYELDSYELPHYELDSYELPEYELHSYEMPDYELYFTVMKRCTLTSLPMKHHETMNPIAMI